MQSGLSSKPASSLRDKLHVGIIMDGNGRWATRRGLSRLRGHEAGVEAIRRVVEAAPDHGVGTLTLYAFSSDNWRRPKSEVAGLMGLLRYYLANEVENLFKNIGGVRNGFAEPIEFDALGNREDYQEEHVWQNLLFGTPDEVVEKLRLYEEVGVDLFCYGPSFGLEWQQTLRSLELFIERVMPAFSG